MPLILLSCYLHHLTMSGLVGLCNEKVVNLRKSVMYIEKYLGET